MSTNVLTLGAILQNTVSAVTSEANNLLDLRTGAEAQVKALEEQRLIAIGRLRAFQELAQALPAHVLAVGMEPPAPQAVEPQAVETPTPLQMRKAGKGD